MTQKDYIKLAIEDYERDIMPFRFVFRLSDGAVIRLQIRPQDVPHLFGIHKLHLRQAQGKSKERIYEMLQNGLINLSHFGTHKEEYKKAMNFPQIISILYCGDIVHVVKKIGSLNSTYLFYLDHSPEEIIHLGVVRDRRDNWHPESLLVTKNRGVDAYIKDQMPVSILEMRIEQI